MNLTIKHCSGFMLLLSHCNNFKTVPFHVSHNTDNTSCSYIKTKNKGLIS